jgi:hypothetical protein
VQFESGDIQIFEGRKLDFGSSDKLVRVGREFGVNLVVVDLEAHLLRRQDWRGHQQKH